MKNSTDARFPFLPLFLLALFSITLFAACGAEDGDVNVEIDTKQHDDGKAENDVLDIGDTLLSPELTPETTPGDWYDRKMSLGPAALFGPNNSEARLTILCDRGRNQLLIQVAGTATPGEEQKMNLYTTAGSEEFTLQAGTGELPMLEVSLPAHDPRLDLLLEANGRFALVFSNGERLVLPTDDSYVHVINYCRSGPDDQGNSNGGSSDTDENAGNNSGNDNGTPGSGSNTDETPAGGDPALSEDVAPDEVIRKYYQYVNVRHYRSAYLLWDQSGKSSGQTYDEFKDGYRNTGSVKVETGTPQNGEGAAGSQFIEVPVDLRAVTLNGVRQHFRGTYVLRRTRVDGATAAQRSWHIYKATIRKVE